MAASSTQTYRAFLSYSSHDKRSALWLQNALESYEVPRRLVGRETPAGPAPRHFRPIFRDGTELAADPDLAARIEGALKSSDYLIVVCSPHAAKSVWVDREIVRFRELHGDSRILTVIVEGSPTNVHEDCFPPALRYRTSEVGAITRSEPIASDLRSGRDGRRISVLKLIAGMLGVGLDELIRRDQQRRQRKLLVLAAGSAVGMAVMGVLATTAVIARNEARVQRAHAEGLIEFMLTDLRGRLEPAGHLDEMDVVGREALKYYVSQRPGTLDADSLVRRARALRLMGEIAMQRGDLGEALASFEQASATTQEVLSRAPNDGKAIFNHAQNVFWVGEIAHQRGDGVAAETGFREYKRLAERLNSIDPVNADWQAEVAYAESALGVLLFEQGRTGEAVAAFEHSLELDELLAKDKPDDLSRQVQLGQGHAWLADALWKQGHLAATRAHRKKELDIYQSVLEKDPRFRQARFSTIVAEQMLGSLYLLEEHISDALTALDRAAGLGESLLGEERGNMDLAATVAKVHVERGEALLAAGDRVAARTAQRRAMELLSSALTHDPTVAAWVNCRDRATLLEAAIDERSGAHAEALRLDRAVQTTLEAKAGLGINTDPFLTLETARLQAGDALAALGFDGDARQQWSRLLTSIKANGDVSSPQLIAVLVAANRRLGNEVAANSLANHMVDLSR